MHVQQTERGKSYLSACSMCSNNGRIFMDIWQFWGIINLVQWSRSCEKLPDYGVWQVEVGVEVMVLVYRMKRCWSQEKAIGFCILAQGRWREAPVMDEESLMLIFYHHFTLTVSCLKQDER